MFDFAFFTFVTIIDLVGAGVIAAGLVKDKWRLFPVWHRVGLVFACIGLTAQAGRNLQFLFTGYSASDADLPLWVFKDFSISIIAITYLVLAMRKEKACPVAKVEPAKPKPKKGPVRGKPSKSR